MLCVLFTAKVFKFQKILKSLAKASGVLCQRCHKRNDPLAGEVDYLNPPSIQQVLVVPKVIELEILTDPLIILPNITI